MARTTQDAIEMQETVKKLHELWMRVKMVLIKAFGTQPITAEQESAFLQLKSEISRIYRSIADELPLGLQFDGKVMGEMLKNALNLEHLRNQPPQERQKFFATWHSIHIKMIRTIGALETMKQGYFPHVHRSRIKSIKPLERKKIA